MKKQNAFSTMAVLKLRGIVFKWRSYYLNDSALLYINKTRNCKIGNGYVHLLFQRPSNNARLQRQILRIKILMLEQFVHLLYDNYYKLYDRISTIIGAIVTINLFV